MADIVAEQWIEIQQLVQMKEFNARRHKKTTRCTFLKFINSFSEVCIQKFLGVLDSYALGKESSLSSYLSPVLQQLKALWSAVKKYHFQLQGFIKEEMEANHFTAAFANEELVFFVPGFCINYLPNIVGLDVAVIAVQLVEENPLEEVCSLFLCKLFAANLFLLWAFQV